MKINIRQIKTRVPSYDLAAASTTGMVRLMDKSNYNFNRLEEATSNESPLPNAACINILSKKHMQGPLTINSMTGLHKASKHLKTNSFSRNDHSLPLKYLPRDANAPALLDAEDASSFEVYCNRIKQSHEKTETRHNSGRGNSPRQCQRREGEARMSEVRISLNDIFGEE